MRIIGGLVIGLLAMVFARMISGLTMANLPAGTERISLVALLLVAAIVGFLAGSTIFRRAARSRDDLALFSGITGGVTGGILGFTYALTMTVSYLSAYSSWPEDRVDQVLVLLAYPIFSTFGLCAGALAGWILGLLFGGILKVSAIAR
jgi:hypothetical protein